MQSAAETGESIDELVARLEGHEGHQAKAAAALSNQVEAAERQADILSQALEQQLLRCDYA